MENTWQIDRLIRSYITETFSGDDDTRADIIRELLELEPIEAIAQILSTMVAITAHLQEVFCGASTADEQLAVWTSVSMDIELSLAQGEFDD